MYRGTTPVLKFIINSSAVDLNKIEQCWVTFETGNNEITFDKKRLEIDPEHKTILLELTQEETLQFSGNVDVQIRILNNEGRAFATPIKKTRFDRILKGGVIE